MFLCECSSCGRRELRGPRSLVIDEAGATATCRACGAEVLVAVLPAGVAAPLDRRVPSSPSLLADRARTLVGRGAGRSGSARSPRRDLEEVPA